ncbi:MAG: DUF4260 domain-containing protein [Bacteroidota bacterium]
MKALIRLEETTLFLFSIYLFAMTDFTWWFPALLLVPDVSMAGYLFNPRVGAAFYNVIHHRGLALVVYGAGLFWDEPLALLSGIILFAHATFDRIFGYGLKHSTSFYHTHLGKIGKDAE